MNRNNIYILEDRGLIYINGDDAKEFLQNIITNNIENVSNDKSTCLIFWVAFSSNKSVKTLLFDKAENVAFPMHFSADSSELLQRKHAFVFYSKTSLYSECLLPDE